MSSNMFMPQVATAIHAIHPVIGAMLVYDAGELLEWGTPTGGGLKSLIGQHSRKTRALYDHAMWPIMAGHNRLDINDVVSDGNAVAAWCNDLILQSRLLAD